MNIRPVCTSCTITEQFCQLQTSAIRAPKTRAEPPPRDTKYSHSAQFRERGPPHATHSRWLRLSSPAAPEPETAGSAPPAQTHNLRYPREPRPPTLPETLFRPVPRSPNISPNSHYFPLVPLGLEGSRFPEDALAPAFCSTSPRPRQPELPPSRPGSSARRRSPSRSGCSRSSTGGRTGPRWTRSV